MQVALTVSDNNKLDKEYDDKRDMFSTPKPFLDAPEWTDSIPEFCCEKRLYDTSAKLMIAQDSLLVDAVRGIIQTGGKLK